MKMKTIIQNSLLGIAVAFMTLGHIPNVSFVGTNWSIQGFGQNAQAADGQTFLECIRNPTSSSWWRGAVCRLAGVALGALSAFKTLQAWITKMTLKNGIKSRIITITIPNRVAGVKIFDHPVVITIVFTETMATVLTALLMFSLMELAFRGCMCLDKIGHENTEKGMQYA